MHLHQLNVMTLLITGTGRIRIFGIHIVKEATQSKHSNNLSCFTSVIEASMFAHLTTGSLPFQPSEKKC